MAPFCRIGGALLVATILASCATSSERQETGAGTAAIITGAAGSVLGAKYGRYLDEQDNRNLMLATGRALDTEATQVYTSSTGVEVTTSARSAPSHAAALRMQVMVAPEVDTNYPLRADRRTVYAMTDMDLRAAPALTSRTTRVFRHGERATVVAYVPQSQYRLVSIDGVAIGYARQVYLAANRQGVSPARYHSTGKVSARASKRRKITRPKKLVVTAECKLVRRVIRLPGASVNTEHATYCKEPPFTWKQMG